MNETLKQRLIRCGWVSKENAPALMDCIQTWVTDQPVPTDEELRQVYIEGYYSVMTRQGPVAQVAGLRAVLARWNVFSTKS